MESSYLKTKNLFCIFAIIVFCSIFTICATTSPLYAICEESHCFFSVGKAILNGQVLYRDILEQKGLLIYVLQIPAYLISHTNFIGVWIIQMLLMTITAILIYKIAINVDLTPSFAFLSVVLFAVIIFTSNALSSSQTVELYVLPGFTFSVYTSCKFLTKKEDIPFRYIFLNGLIAGIILWMKYSLLGFYFAWAAVICIRLLLNNKPKKAFKSGALFILGMISISIPCVLYFAANKSIPDLINYYFLNNIQEYGEKINFADIINSYSWTFFHQFDINKVLFLCILASLLLTVISKISLTLKLQYIFCIVLQFCTVYLHGAMMSYYFFAFSIFLIPGIIITLYLFQKTVTTRVHFKKTISILCMVATTVTVSLTSLCVAFYNRPRPARFLESTDGLAQYEFAKYMNQKTESPTLLDFNELDGGFYTFADIIPSTWAYCKLNWQNPQMDADLLNTVSEKKVEFVIVRLPGDVNIESQNMPVELMNNYAVVKKITQYRVNDLFSYFLLEKK